MKKQKMQQSGSILVSIIIMMPFFLLIAAAYLQLAVSGFRIARKDQFRTHAQQASDAGIDASLESINLDGTWPGSGGEVNLHNDGNIRTTYQTTVTSVDANNKNITAVGRTYSPANSSSASASVTIDIDLRPIRSGEFSIVTGVGGLYMSNSAKVLGGDVFINGELNMKNTAQVGLASNPVDLRVAHQNCPAPADPTHDAEYPRICNPGENGEPITLQNTSHIYGQVRANNQTSPGGITDPGIVASSGVETQLLPPHDRAVQKAAISQNQTGDEASCTSVGGSVTWPANLKITGDVLVSKNCKVTIEGDVWITGKFEMENSGQVIVSNALGTTRPNIMIDSQTTKLRNSSQIVSNTSNKGAQVISYWSTAGCSPDCADVDGSDLYNSRDEVTIELDNTASGPNTIYYSKWTKVLISNSGQIGALIGQTVELRNSGTITFGTSVGVGTTYWVIDNYRRTF